MKTIITLILFLASLPAFAASPVASLVASRTSGTAPLCLHVDLTGSTDADTSNPFRDLSYLVNFGDPSAGTWTNGTGLTNKNIAAAPVAGHCFETAGTYTVTARVCDATTCSTDTETITVTAADTTFATTATVCFFNTVVGSGCPTGATETATSDFDTAMASCVGNTKRCLFKAGDTFTKSAVSNFGATSLVHIGKYGTGADPIISGTSVNSLGFNNAATADIRVVDLDFVGSGSGDTGVCFSVGASVTNVALIRVTCRDSSRGLSVTSGFFLTNFYLIDSHIYDYYASGGNAFFGQVTGGAFIGNIIGPVPLTGSGEHGIRIQRAFKVAVANNTFRRPNAAKHALTVRGDVHTAGASWSDATDSRYVAITDNHFDASTATNDWVLQLGPSGDTQCHWGRDVLVERNRFDLLTPQIDTSIISAFSRVTIRNNVMNSNTGAVLANVVTSNAGTCSADPSPNPANAPPAPDDVWIGYNSIYTSATITTYYPIRFGSAGTSATNGTAKNNLIYSPNVSSTITIPLLQGTTTGNSASNNSTGSSSTNQAKNTDPLWDDPTPETPAQFRPDVTSYATSGGTALFPGSTWDFYLCRDRTGAARMGALVPAARAQCSGTAGAP